MKAFQNAGLDVYGIEPSEPFYNRAIEQMGFGKEQLQLKAVEDASFEKEFFDIVSISAVLEHVYDPSETIKKSMEWLKKDGLLHIEVPSSSWLVNSLANFIYKIQGYDFVANISPMHSPFHLYEFELDSFKLNSELLNYDIAEHRYYVADTFLPKFLDPIVKPWMKFRNSGMQIEVWLRKK